MDIQKCGFPSILGYPLIYGCFFSWKIHLSSIDHWGYPQETNPHEIPMNSSKESHPICGSGSAESFRLSESGRET